MCAWLSRHSHLTCSESMRMFWVEHVLGREQAPGAACAGDDVSVECSRAGFVGAVMAARPLLCCFIEVEVLLCCFIEVEVVLCCFGQA